MQRYDGLVATELTQKENQEAMCREMVIMPENKQTPYVRAGPMCTK